MGEENDQRCAAERDREMLLEMNILTNQQRCKFSLYFIDRQM